jgi:hypothetical protein
MTERGSSTVDEQNQASGTGSDGETSFAFTAPDVKPRIGFQRVRHSDQAESAPTRRRWRRRWQVVTATVTAAALLAGTGWVGFRGYRAAGNLTSAAQMFAMMQRQVQAGDVAAARSTLAAAQKETREASTRTGDLAWKTAALLPGIGDDLAAVSTMSHALDDLTHNGLPPLLDAAGVIGAGTLAPADGKIDLRVLGTATERLANGAAVVRRVSDKVERIDTDGLTSQVGNAVTQLRRALRTAQRTIAPADRAARLLPSVLGAAGPRTYLVLFQNNAEVRATGGMPGAFIVVQANGGAVTVVDQGTAAAAIRNFPAPVLPLDPDAEQLYTDRLATFPADVNLTPDFPTAANLAREMYRIRSGRSVDGVLATDPVALSYLLKATGPVTMPHGAPLTAQTAVKTLLSDVYRSMDNAQQDAYFAGAALAAFRTLTRKQSNPRAVLAELARATNERRLLMWSAHPGEQELIAGTAIAGTLPGDDKDTPTVGVFLNDGTGAKLSYYLTQAAELTVGGCAQDGSRELRLKVTIGSTAPASGLSKSVTGLALAGEPYTVRTNVMIFSPTGGAIADAHLDGTEIEFGTGAEHGRSVAVATIDLPPGARSTLAVRVITGPLPVKGTTIRPRLVTTPMVAPWTTDIGRSTPCEN